MFAMLLGLAQEEAHHPPSDSQAEAVLHVRARPMSGDTKQLE